MKSFNFKAMTSEAPQWHNAFSRFADQVMDWSPVFQAIAEDFKKGQIEQFRTEGAYGSGGWKALSPKYAAWKEQHKPGMPILVFSGLLMKAATNPDVAFTENQLMISIDDAGSYQVFSKRLGRLVTKHKPAVAGYHQKGAGRLPKRLVIQLPESQKVRWRKIFQSYMVAATRGNPWNSGSAK
jgi:hypothetical protein